MTKAGNQQFYQLPRILFGDAFDGAVNLIKLMNPVLTDGLGSMGGSLIAGNFIFPNTKLVGIFTCL